jgi:SAM-dependent methyltransferase
MKAPHPFPARMAPDLALQSVSRVAEGPILDPMCGSGMVLKAAADAGHRSFGFDVDPLAVLMSTVWVSPPPKDLEDCAARVVRKAATLVDPALEWIDADSETADFVNFWFAEAQQRDLRRLSRVLADMTDEPEANALRLALSRIIVTKMRGASLASDVSHSRPHKTRTTNDYDVFAGFLAASRAIGKALDHSPTRTLATAQIGDARRLEQVEDGSIGMVVTSPPYLNAIDYLRGHRLALVWLGHKIPALRSIRATSIGTERRWTDSFADTPLAEAAAELNLANFSPRLQGLLARYLVDMDSLTKEIARVLRPRGEAVLVIGNSTIRGEYADNAQFARAAAACHGLELVERTERVLPENRRYLPPPREVDGGHLAKRMRSEVILTLRKAA